MDCIGSSIENFNLTNFVFHCVYSNCKNSSSISKNKKKYLSNKLGGKTGDFNNNDGGSGGGGNNDRNDDSDEMNNDHHSTDGDGSTLHAYHHHDYGNFLSQCYCCNIQ
jgi:hypothetical protein